jgi:hypothetical protein
MVDKIEKVEKVAQTTIARSADDVWSRIGDFGDVSWVPNTASCVVVDGVRTIRMHGVDVDVIERLTDEDAKGRSYSFNLGGELNLEKIFGPGRIARGDDLAATLKVTPQGESESRVTWDLAAVDYLIDGTHAEYQAALDHLKEELER